MERTKTDFSGAQLSFDDEIVVDGFCGGGGWSTGFELAVGRPVDIGINHDAAAIAMHRKNHPYTRHYNANIWDVDPREACAGRPVGWAHFSPDCKHFSRAKGGKPVSKKIRGLAWVVIKWAGTVFPRIISMENVIEFTTWGPLVAARDKKSGRVLKQDGSIAEPGERVPVQEQKLVPDKRRAGKTFRRFVGELRALGYTVEWRELTACDYGAPTTRRRFFLLARRGEKPIVWPEPTHGAPDSEGVLSGRLQPWRTAAEIIDWSKPCPSIFERKNIFGSDILCHRNCWICWNKPAPKEYQNMDKKKVEVEDRWAYMEDGSAVCPRCGKRYERRKFEFVGACCEACGANNIVKTEIKEDE